MTREEQRTVLEDRRQAARLEAIVAYARYEGARALFDGAGADPAWRGGLPDEAKNLMISGVDHLRRAYEAAASEEALTMSEDMITMLNQKFRPDVPMLVGPCSGQEPGHEPCCHAHICDCKCHGPRS